MTLSNTGLQNQENLKKIISVKLAPKTLYGDIHE